MKSYENENNKGIWTAGICKNKKTNKYILYALVGDKNYFEKMCEKGYKIIEVVNIKNVNALYFFNYHKKFPIKESIYKFDFFKYVLGANFTNLDYKKQFEKN